MPAVQPRALRERAPLPAIGLQSRSDLAPRDVRLLVFAAVAAHVLGLWALLQVDSVRETVRELAPTMVDLIAPAVPEPAPLPSPPPVRRPAPVPPVPAPQPRTPAATPAPLLAAPATLAATPDGPTVPSPVPTPPAVPPLEAPTPVAQAPAPPAALSPPRKLIPATALRYRIEPPFEVPRASRRAGEYGIVQLRVVVSASGEPIQVRVLRSSGYPRLDEQALWAMRQARLTPYTEDGRPIEIEAIATADYPQE